MKYWRDKGTPVEKLNMGFAVYGRTFRLSTEASNVGAPISGPASAGAFTREAGFWSYYEVKLITVNSDIILQHEVNHFLLFSDLHFSPGGHCPHDRGPESPICCQTE